MNGERRIQILEEIEETRLVLEVAQSKRDAAILKGVKAGIPGSALGEAAGISKQRVSQIVKGAAKRTTS